LHLHAIVKGMSDWWPNCQIYYTV